MQSIVERLPWVAPLIRKSNPGSYADTPFTDDIALIEMPRKLSFPNIKMYDRTGDPDDHIAQYKQRMLAVALPRESREATMSAKVQVEINMKRPLKFALRAQLPSGEIVLVKLVYSNLHRHCRHCRMLKKWEKILNARSLPEPSKDRRSGEDTHRDTWDSVWKRIDSRFTSKTSHSNLKLKEKISETDEVSDEGSSATKNLNFEAPSDPPSVNLPSIPNQAPPIKEIPKSWYEMTLEDEGNMGEEAMNIQEPQQAPNNLENFGLPLNERILEEEDWLDDGNDFGDADGNEFGEEDVDLMEEDDLLGEELQTAEEKHPIGILWN
ncbi:hypothetical protein F2Q69_00052290 [Brassica cretica]|uniref:DUF4283 domain-containing protein n=1 Tax=Brassica cretica TaxID=69181 RepID=A0A8S9MVR5_BRACR|nr:hypothetical protein F2Q69_00052290 [Brassica cretica]